MKRCIFALAVVLALFSACSSGDDDYILETTTTPYETTVNPGENDGLLSAPWQSPFFVTSRIGRGDWSLYVKSGISLVLNCTFAKLNGDGPYLFFKGQACAWETTGPAD